MNKTNKQMCYKFSEKNYCKLFLPSFCTFAERMINIKTLLKVPQKVYVEQDHHDKEDIKNSLNSHP